MIRAMSTLAQRAAAPPPQDHLLERFDDFLGAFHRVEPAPAPLEFAKLDALRDDLVWLQRRGPDAPPLSWLGRRYRSFEHLVAAEAAPDAAMAALPANAAVSDAG